MKVYEINSDIYKTRSLGFSDESVIDHYFGAFKGKPITDWDKPVEMFITDLKDPIADFYYYYYGCLVFTPKVLDCMADIFEMAGQILPVQVESGEELFILNVTACCDSVDQKKTEWEYYPNGNRGSVKKYAFGDNFSKSSLFKIPENNFSSILTLTGAQDSSQEFISRYRQHNLTGLVFKELWASDDEPTLKLA